MRKNVLLSICGRQSYPGQEPDSIELVTAGTMEQVPGGWELSYLESDLTGLDGVKTVFRVEDNKITLTRQGRLRSEMVFMEGMRHESLYQMEFGALMMVVCARKISANLSENGGTVDLVYSIEIEQSMAGTVDYHLDVKLTDN